MEQTDSEWLKTPLEQGARNNFFSRISDRRWNDWRWQLRQRITTVEDLSRFVRIRPAHREMFAEMLRDFRMGISPYYLSLMNFQDPHDPILRQAVPLKEEYLFSSVGEMDALNEEGLSPVPGLTHRYPDRVLMLVSNTCAVYCRHCTRKRIMSEKPPTESDIDRMVAYIARTPSIRDVIVSGGDPLTLATSRLERILQKVRAIPHVQVIRIGSRVPVTLPMRIDEELTSMLQKYHPIWLNTHFNHPRECTELSAQACDRLLRAGIPINNQSVLLRGVNDDVETMRKLVHSLMMMRVRPYYLFQCDPVQGTEHLRTPIAKGIEIMKGLRGHTSGLAIPQYVIDSPGGLGKIPVGSDYLVSYDEKSGKAVLRNYQGKLIDYQDPMPIERLAQYQLSSPGAR